MFFVGADPVRGVEENARLGREAARKLGVASHADLIVEASRAKKLPTMFHESSMAATGALASYGASFYEAGRISARVLTGTPAKDLPVENYDKIEFVLNLRTAREIGLTIPLSVRDWAHRVIE